MNDSSQSSRCRCGVYIWGGPHVCPPRWIVQDHDAHNLDDDDDSQVVHATSASDAAERYAAHSDNQGDYTCVGGSDLTVRVRREDQPESTWETFVVEGRTEAAYYARPKT